MNDLTLDLKTALVTGVNRDIGRAAPVELARAGGRVALSDRSRERTAFTVRAPYAADAIVDARC